jgi:hypothetical protein
MTALWNHAARIYRDVPVRGPMGSSSTWTLVHTPAGRNARGDISTQGTTHDAGGERAATNRRWFLTPTFRPMMGDVLDIIGGPEAPTRVRVLTVVAAEAMSGMHHYEVITEQYTGALS